MLSQKIFRYCVVCSCFTWSLVCGRVILTRPQDTNPASSTVLAYQSSETTLFRSSTMSKDESINGKPTIAQVKNEMPVPAVVKKQMGPGRPITTDAPDELSRSQLISKILKNYKSDIRPSSDQGIPTKVKVSIFVTSMDTVDEAKMEYRLTFLLRQSWLDERLKYDEKYIKQRNRTVLVFDQAQTSKIWVPDLYFANEKDAMSHKITVPNVMMHISPNGGIYYSQRLSAVMTCHMHLQKYPMDSQICGIQMESYAYSTDDLIFEWRNVKTNPATGDIISNDVSIAQFYIDSVDMLDCTKQWPMGVYTCLKMNFKLKRDVIYYLIGTYIPSALVLGLTWINFWISVEAVPARISLGVITILTIETQSIGVRSRLPPVSYLNAMDVWMTMCKAMTFCGLLEYAVVNVMLRTWRPLFKSKTKVVPLYEDEDEKRLKLEAYDRAVKVDKMFRILFPCAFLLFNAFYWSYFSMLEISKQQNA